MEPHLAGKWICPMHPEVIADGPDDCDICGMDLVPLEELGYRALESDPEPPLVIPAWSTCVTSIMCRSSNAGYWKHCASRSRPATS